MTGTPAYVVHRVSEKEVTVDWFFARGHPARRLRQLGLILVGWVFAILPMVITASALLYRHDRSGGWWRYREGFYMWDVTTRTLELLMVVFIVVFFALYLLNRVSAGERDRTKTYDEARLARRLELAEHLYAGKFGHESFRLERKDIVIEPYEDVETYELRDLYRAYGAD